MHCVIQFRIKVRQSFKEKLITFIYKTKKQNQLLL